jgi:preprotein translocase subunit SecY
VIPGVQDAAKIPELRRRVLLTLVLLLIYRVGVFIPTPGIDSARFKALFEQAAGTVFGMVNMFSGGALENFSVFALGIMPYISVSIIVQLLTHSVKHLEDLSKEGEQGRRVITKYTRWGTIVLALIQGTAISYGLESQGVVANPGWFFRIQAAITLTAGTAFIMWLGEQITERGIGNGISLIITAGIIARMPATLLQTFDLMNTGEITPFSMLGLMAFGIATVAFIVYVERSNRRIPVQYPKRSAGGRMTQATAQHMPLKVNSASVMPPIFASAFMFFPATIAQFSQVEWLSDYVAMLQPGSGLYEGLFAVLIVFFTFFYTSLIFDPNQIAENLKKNGGFIPTVRPGRDTANFLNRVLTRLTVWAAIYLCIVCIVPQLFYVEMGAASFTYFFGGTAILIVVGVTMDTLSQIESHVVARNYEGFMNKSPGKIRGASRATQMSGRLIRR